MYLYCMDLNTLNIEACTIEQNIHTVESMLVQLVYTKQIVLLLYLSDKHIPGHLAKTTF